MKDGGDQAIEKSKKIGTYKPMNGEIKDDVSEKAFRM